MLQNMVRMLAGVEVIIQIIDVILNVVLIWINGDGFARKNHGNNLCISLPLVTGWLNVLSEVFYSKIFRLALFQIR
ncbi:hypothetical protein BFW25_14385 [Aeromonas caviae]|nr:hypothetical protein BFW25_14385 [Aeromonas caviae]